jgi:oligopeptide/dipeptide ABC transporter ATP-binding protein
MTSLNPTLTIGRQVAEPLMIHRGLSRAKAYKEAARWLDHVKIPAAADRLNDYPYQLSGGMRQRVMIAMAMICNPKLLIADEPTTALDVTIQAQILSLMIQLKEEFGMSLLLISHNLGVIAQMAARVIVMYAGQVVETASIADIFERPFHPYTQGLLKARPRLGSYINGLTDKLHEIKGIVPSLTEKFIGCRFADRCPHTFARCLERDPELYQIRDDHRARCWLNKIPERRQNHH